MKRFILDILIVLLIVSIVSVASNQQQQSVSIDDKLTDFEAQIENGAIYQPDKQVYLLQVEENRAGKLGNALSNFVVHVIEEGVGIVREIFDVF